jgi:hypothetical protein
MSSKFGITLLSTLALGALFATEARAANLGSPALYAYVGRYNLSLSPAVGSMCVNQTEMMPSGRQVLCGYPATVKTATGRYRITVSNGAPLPTSPVDRGYAVWVQAIGSNAQCFEESTTWTGSPNYTLTSNVRCVAPSPDANTNTDVDSEFAWSYRTDSWEWMQKPSQPNYGYARVNRASGSLVTAQSYLPLMNFDIQSSRTGTGRYTVVFNDLNPADVMPIEGFIGNIIVQKTCSADSAASCRRSVCIPQSWTQGSNTGVWDTTVNVRCYGPNGAARDTDFRVFAGDEAHNSQYVHSDRGGRYAWLNYTNDSTSNTCFSPSNFLHRAQHETPTTYFPTVPIQICKTAPGRFTVNLAASNFIGSHFIQPYHVDDISPVVSGRATAGGYCNPHQIVCNGVNCTFDGNDPPSRIDVRCYDRTGAAQNASFNLSMFY